MDLEDTSGFVLSISAGFLKGITFAFFVFCLSKDLAKLEDIKNVIERKDPAVEIVLTGRGATRELIELADLVTEMKNIKHPFDKGIEARQGIEF